MPNKTRRREDEEEADDLPEADSSDNSGHEAHRFAIDLALTKLHPLPDPVVEETD